ncbi:MAG TPA: CDP-glycerol glycerophosphotransferase family protein [Candidatus Atribacteria bacterium]|nr:CDP-glycerol glycerophosphotransferase family protein [Candidatus Atribacteria bacterium]
MNGYLKSGIPKPFRTMLQDLRRGFSALYYYLFRVFPINNKKIVISSYYGKGFSDNPKYIALELLKQGCGYDIVWLVRPEFNTGFPDGIRAVRYGTMKAAFELTTARVWIDNCRKAAVVKKRKGQYYIQTWHGGLGIKRIEGDAIESLSRQYVISARFDSTMIDLLISNSKHLTDIYKRAFWYDGEIYECGYPKNDIFFKDNVDIKRRVRSFYGVDDTTKIALYAPTFRDHQDLSAYDMDYHRVIAALEHKTGDRWILLIRLHPNLAELNDGIQYGGKLINATRYPDMGELAIACDLLISDYSSAMFDAEMQKKPTFIYASDYDKYMDNRGSYFDMKKDLPFPLATNSDELVNNIAEFDQREYEANVDRFNERVGLKETGRAAELVAERIRDVVFGAGGQ